MTNTPSASKILFCTDFSPNANIAYSYALQAAQQGNAELHLLHVIPSPDAQYWKPYIYEVNEDVDQRAKEAFDKKVDEQYKARTPDTITLHTAFRIGKAYFEIAKYADEIKADLVVIGRQGRGALESLLFGSVAEKVVAKVHCPVLVIPMPDNH